MGQDLATVRATFKASKAPQLTESQRRLLADPFHLGDVVPAWEPPAVLPDSAKLRAVKQELERGLAEPHPGHMEWCTRKLLALPSRSNSELDKAYQTENFIDACGHYPNDIWTWATTELLKAKTFRPSPAEMVAVAEPKLAERRRMLERVKIMLEGKPAIPVKPFKAEPRDARVRGLRDSFRKVGQVFKAAGYERELAPLENREVEDWARDLQVEPSKGEERPRFVPATSPTAKRCAELASAFHSGKPAPEHRDIPEAGHG